MTRIVICTLFLCVSLLGQTIIANGDDAMPGDMTDDGVVEISTATLPGSDEKEIGEDTMPARCKFVCNCSYYYLFI